MLTNRDKSITFGFDKLNGRCKYCKLLVLHLKVLTMCCSFASLMLMGTIKDFEKNTFRTIDSPKVLRRPLRVQSCLLEASIMIIVSSAY
jgi:hypothetical protein